MFKELEILRMAHGLAEHAGHRQTVIARNVANADTPGFRAKDIDGFSEFYSKSDEGLSLRTTRANHFSAGDSLGQNIELFDSEGDVDPNGNSVSLESEMVKAAETKRQHDMALAVYHSSMGILRTSLGRGR
ncbi:Flagellar basal-body rod protein FlgB [Rhodovulum sp. P5]|uniref:FlgB family protein n=1 Tax=Rhodovulum sp. P5 TaxID=1564506 RepID=UPI0009C2E29E|nr:FlgB family protein [Rhodovulum sp. P5]ARE40398.1 Flagellar basal-body rod protein FlgB [Rhodovulum sp. P5]